MQCSQFGRQVQSPRSSMVDSVLSVRAPAPLKSSRWSVSPRKHRHGHRDRRGGARRPTAHGEGRERGKAVTSRRLAFSATWQADP